MISTSSVRLITRCVDGVQAKKDGRLGEYLVELALAYFTYSLIKQAVKENRSE